ncbi:MAG: hypothetical protein HQL58_12545 [Magnetococcales bacterium]|nr:hypothetical protein [Magnetococcales bacterium]
MAAMIDDINMTTSQHFNACYMQHVLLWEGLKTLGPKTLAACLARGKQAMLDRLFFDCVELAGKDAVLNYKLETLRLLRRELERRASTVNRPPKS